MEAVAPNLNARWIGEVGAALATLCRAGLTISEQLQQSAEVLAALETAATTGPDEVPSDELTSSRQALISSGRFTNIRNLRRAFPSNKALADWFMAAPNSLKFTLGDDRYVHVETRTPLGIGAARFLTRLANRRKGPAPRSWPADQFFEYARLVLEAGMSCSAASERAACPVSARSAKKIFESINRDLQLLGGSIE